MNCDNTSSCGTAEYKVENDSGVLTGYAWSENTGYIDFAGVTISGEEFSGYAYSPNVGWISMNCSNTDSCGTVDYKVTTTWRRSSGTTSGSMPTAINNFKATQQTLATPTVPPISVSCILNFTQILKLTTPLMKNTNVKDLQTCLNTKIPPPLLVTDGVFGPKSKDALMNFQKANNLKVDGIVGPITRGLLTK
jgi:hypothetical protein